MLLKFQVPFKAENLMAKCDYKTHPFHRDLSCQCS